MKKDNLKKLKKLLDEQPAHTEGCMWYHEGRMHYLTRDGSTRSVSMEEYNEKQNKRG